MHSPEDYFDKLKSSSCKLQCLDQLIRKFRKEGKKMLIFSQFTEMLKLIEEYLLHEGIAMNKIDGATKARDRQLQIDSFNAKDSGFGVFLLSTKAGGVGINLTAAQVVVIFDSDWNP